MRNFNTKKISVFFSSLFSTLALYLALPLTVLAETGDVEVEGLKNGIQSFTDLLAGFATPICVLVLVVAGIALMSGQQGRQWAKPTMLWAGIGYVVVSFAQTLVNMLSASFVA